MTSDVQKVSTSMGGPLVWPQELHLGWMAGAAFLAGMMLLGVIVVARAIGAGDVISVLTFGGVTIGLGGFVALSVSLGGVRLIGLSRRVSTGVDPVAGRGVVIAARRGLVIALAVSLFGVSMYGSLAAATHYLGGSDALLPEGRQTDGGAAWMAIVGAVLLAAAIAIVVAGPRAQLFVGSVGLRSRAKKWNKLVRADEKWFVAWGDITAIDAESRITHNSLSDIVNPRIVVHSVRSTSNGIRPDSGPDRTATIITDRLAVEPNTLLSLLRYLEKHPEHRDVVTTPDARELLRPPSLRKRFRAAQKSATGE